MLDLNEKLKAYPEVQIATVSGRYYAMDRDKRWDRIEKAYLCLTEGVGTKRIRRWRRFVIVTKTRLQTSLFFPPSSAVWCPEGLIRDGDGVIFFNFRADRARELTRALTEEDFREFPRKRPVALSTFVTMTQHDETFKLPVAYTPREIKKILGELASQAGIRQLRIAGDGKVRPRDLLFQRRRGEQISRRRAYPDPFAQGCSYL